jgi:hypothetical protein
MSFVQVMRYGKFERIGTYHDVKYQENPEIKQVIIRLDDGVNLADDYYKFRFNYPFSEPDDLMGMLENIEPSLAMLTVPKVHDDE